MLLTSKQYSFSLLKDLPLIFLGPLPRLQPYSPIWIQFTVFGRCHKILAILLFFFFNFHRKASRSSSVCIAEFERKLRNLSSYIRIIFIFSFVSFLKFLTRSWLSLIFGCLYWTWIRKVRCERAFFKKIIFVHSVRYWGRKHHGVTLIIIINVKNIGFVTTRRISRDLFLRGNQIFLSQSFIRYYS